MNYFDVIHKYFEGEMTQKEMEHFELELLENTQLMEEFNAYKDITSTFKDITQPKVDPPSHGDGSTQINTNMQKGLNVFSKSNFQFFLYPISITIIVVGSFILFYKVRKNNEKKLIFNNRIAFDSIGKDTAKIETKRDTFHAENKFNIKNSDTVSKIDKIEVFKNSSKQIDFQIGSWYYIENGKEVRKHGLLYNWNTALNSCPLGTHIPSIEEWDNLIEKHGGVHDPEEPDDLITLQNIRSAGYEIEFGGSGMQTADNIDFFGMEQAGYYWSNTQIDEETAVAYFFYRENGKIQIKRNHISKSQFCSCLCVPN